MHRFSTPADLDGAGEYLTAKSVNRLDKKIKERVGFLLFMNKLVFLYRIKLPELHKGISLMPPVEALEE